MERDVQQTRVFASLSAGRRRLYTVALALLVALGGSRLQLEAAPRELVPGRIAIRLRSEQSSASVLSAPRMQKASIAKAPMSGGPSKEGVLDKLGVMVVNVPPAETLDAVNEMAARPDVRFAAPIYRYWPALVPNDPSFSSQYHHNLMGNTTAWNRTTGAGNLIIAICDTGVEASHPDLSAHVLNGYNFYNNSTDTTDPQGHGTAVAGAAAAVGNNSVGVAGVAMGCAILPVRISGPDGSAYSDTIAAAIKFAADSNAKVINCSFGPLQGDTVVESAAAYARSKGSLVFVSSGNEGNRDPAAGNPNVLYIGSTDETDAVSSFSTYGPAVKLVAPGNRIYTTKRNSGYGYFTGTSFSSPIAAGVAALCWSANPSLTASEVENCLISTARDLGATGFDERAGYGRIDAARAVAAAAALEPVMAEMEAPTPGSKINSSAVTFRWTPGSRVQDYWLDVGSATDRVKYFSSYFPLGTTSAVVSNLPQDGSQVNVVLYSRVHGTWKTYQYTYQTGVAVVTPSELTSPTNGATLTSSQVTFRWTAGQSVSAYWLDVGTLTNRVQFLNSGTLPLGTTSASVNGLPTDGSIVTAVLYSKVFGAWQTKRYEFRASNPPVTLATLTSPTPGTTLSGSTVTFNWTAGEGVQDYWLDVGTPSARTKFFSSYFGPAARSATVSGIAADGQPVQVTLYSRVAGSWRVITYMFTAATPTLAELTSPEPGSVLSGRTATFRWTAGAGATDYWLDVGTVSNRTLYHSRSYAAGVLTATVSGLPLNGSALQAVLYSRINGVWLTRTYSLRAGLPTPARLIEPVQTAAAPGQLPVLPGSTVRFAWSEGVGVDQYWLDVGVPGTTSGDRIRYFSSSFPLGQRSVSVSGLPLDGRTIRVILYSRIDGVWTTEEYQFQAGR